MCDKALALSLVHAHLIEHPEIYSSFVQPYTQLRYCPTVNRLLATRVGGHYRRLAQWKDPVAAVCLTCKFEPLSRRTVRPRLPPVKKRWEGLARRFRVLVFA